MYRAALGAFEQVNPNLLGAARTLGASEFRTFRRVLLPLAMPGVIAGTVLAFARALGEFGATLMFAGNIPGRTQTMPIAIFFAAEAGDMRRALGWVVLTVVLSLVSIAALNVWAPRQHVPKRRTPQRASPLERAAAPVITIAPVAAASAPTLVAEFHKTYTGFDLSVAFSAGGAPLGLLGASGSGKSMTLRCIAGLVKPQTGRVILNGRTLLDTSRGIDVRPSERRVGVVFQDYALFPHLTVRENIGFSLQRLAATERNKRVLLWSAMMQIDSLLDDYPDQLSGGQRQRVALARALAMEPEALLLDEPFAALDPHLRRQMEERLRQTLAHYGGVTIFVTHDRDEAYRFCESLAVLAEGKIAAIGPKKEIFARPRSLAAARLTGCKNFSRIARTGANTIHAEDWNCTIHVHEAVPSTAGFIGLRAHDVLIGPRAGQTNVVPCWLVSSVESPFETTLYLRLHTMPRDGDRAHLEAEVSREQWAELAAQPQPWSVYIDPGRLLFLEP
jgi:molybdate transport system permease protein